MSKVIIIQCNYCGYMWRPKAKIYGSYYVSDSDHCPKCKDKNLEKHVQEVDYYAKEIKRKKKD